MVNVLEMASRAATHSGWAGGWGGPWWLFVPLLWIALVATVIWLVARRKDGRDEAPASGAVGILAARYARGEIDTEEYRSRVDEIRGSS